MIRRCVSGPETQAILDQYHHGPTGGHYGPTTTAKKVFNSGFHWPTIINEAHTLVRLCDARQKTGNISKRDKMPLNSIQVETIDARFSLSVEENLIYMQSADNLVALELVLDHHLLDHSEINLWTFLHDKRLSDLANRTLSSELV
ncbi:reverse transcriptase domain-containing protein [Tanacetum coccineum]